MAILEDLGLEVKIIANNSPLQEYEDKEVDPTDDGFGDEIRKCRRYVEVFEDAEFSAQFRVTSALKNADERFRFALDLDGQEDLEDQFLGSDSEHYLVKGKDEYHGQTLVLRKFRFSTVATGRYPQDSRSCKRSANTIAVDDDNTERVIKDRKAARHLGLIRVRVWRCDGQA